MAEPKVSTEAVRRFRKRKKAAGLKEIRGIYASPEHEGTIKDFARTIHSDDELLTLGLTKRIDSDGRVSLHWDKRRAAL